MYRYLPEMSGYGNFRILIQSETILLNPNPIRNPEKLRNSNYAPRIQTQYFSEWYKQYNRTWLLKMGVGGALRTVILRLVLIKCPSKAVLWKKSRNHKNIFRDFKVTIQSKTVRIEFSSPKPKNAAGFLSISMLISDTSFVILSVCSLYDIVHVTNMQFGIWRLKNLASYCVQFCRGFACPIFRTVSFRRHRCLPHEVQLHFCYEDCVYRYMSHSMWKVLIPLLA